MPAIRPLTDADSHNPWNYFYNANTLAATRLQKGGELQRSNVTCRGNERRAIFLTLMTRGYRMTQERVRDLWRPLARLPPDEQSFSLLIETPKTTTHNRLPLRMTSVARLD
jgi:hypothetical protein